MISWVLLCEEMSIFNTGTTGHTHQFIQKGHSRSRSWPIRQCLAVHTSESTKTMRSHGSCLGQIEDSGDSCESIKWQYLVLKEAH